MPASGGRAGRCTARCSAAVLVGATLPGLPTLTLVNQRCQPGDVYMGSPNLAAKLWPLLWRQSSMESEQPTLPVSQAFMETADVLLVLDDGAAVPCHSQILAMHSPVLFSLLRDVPNEHNEVVRIPLADFTQAQCSALLGCLYYNISSNGAAFETHGVPDQEAVAAVARFAHTYDSLHALQHLGTYLVAYVQRRFFSVSTGGAFGAACKRNLLTWAIMADKYDLQELCGYCELALIKYWDRFHDTLELVDQLSSGALQRVALGLNKTLSASRALVNQLSRQPCFQNAPYPEARESEYPDVREVIAWRQRKQPSCSNVEGRVASGKRAKR